MKTVVGDTVIAYDPDFINFPNYLIGDLNDPIFGKSTAGVYMRFTGPSRYEGLDTVRADSVVLVLPYDSASFYGNTINQQFSFDILELATDLDPNLTYSTDTTLLTEAVPLLSNLTFRPNTVDSLSIIEAIGGEEDTLLLAPQLRIRLPETFDQRIIDTDSLVFESDSLFFDRFRGFEIRPTTETDGMLSFDLQPGSGAGLYFYYHRGDSVFARSVFDANRVLISTFKQDTTGTPIDIFVNDQENADSIFFVQGMRGRAVEMILPEMPDLEDVIINKAEITLTVADLPGDDLNLYSPTEQLILGYFQDSNVNERTVIDDAEFAGNEVDNIISLFGGNVETDSDGVSTYTMSIGAHLQRVLEGEIDRNLYLQPLSRSQNASRVAFKGSGALQNKAVLRIFYTEITN